MELFEFGNEMLRPCKSTLVHRSAASCREVAEVERTVKKVRETFLKASVLFLLSFFPLLIIDGADKSKLFSVGGIYTKGVMFDSRLLWFYDLAPVTLHKINTYLYHLANPKAS